MPLRNLMNETNTKGNYGEKELDDDIVKQFKLIITVVFIILILSLLYFVYNLIKCIYLNGEGAMFKKINFSQQKSLQSQKKKKGQLQNYSNMKNK